MKMLILGAAILCSGCVVRGTSSGGLAVDPAYRVVPARAYNTPAVVVQQPAPTYVLPTPPYTPPSVDYVQPGSPYPPPNPGLPDWTPQ